jgi:hypothetical protein
MIRDMKDIPMKNVMVSIPQPDWTEEEMNYHLKKISRQAAEKQAKINGQDFEWIVDSNGVEHFTIKDNRCFLEKIFGGLF